ncbi:hypothetical protein GMOD_00010333 [Pyrenophora seminiperda CCB06]|uniref:Uncharacterized protein n=1 Tax=Pyrenophora seminiperda CCB06 TaxID=1302712 RepID=A0A3M7M5B2_9PLEO|nr:hypothetical protein GMOD_00010333 [Pyrenophora seminiperda CCB06]
MTIKDKIRFYIENKKKREQIKTYLICMFICLFIFILFLNVFLLLCGFIISTLNLTSFFYTLFCKVVFMKTITTLVISFYTKELSLNSLSLSVPSVIFIFILGGINCYYFIPLVKNIIGIGLINADTILKNIITKIEGVKLFDPESLLNGIVNILTKTPIIGKYLIQVVEYRSLDNSNNRYSPFRI